MASIQTRTRATKTTYRVRWYEGGRQLDETFDSPDQAADFKALLEIHHGTPPGWIMGVGFSDDAPAGTLNFEHAFEDFLSSRATSADPATLAKYRKVGDKQFLPRWRRRAVADLTLRDVQDWINARATEVAAKTVANEHGILFGVFERAIQSGALTANPCAHSRLPKRRQLAKGEGYISPAQFQVLLEACKPDIRDFVMFGAITGARWGELAALRPSDVFESDTPDVVWVHIDKAISLQPGADGKVRQTVMPPKTEASLRDIAITAPGVRAYALALARAATGRPVLFSAPRGGSWRYSTFHEDRWVPALAAARAADPSIPEGVTFHWIRHSFAWWNLDKGNTPVAVRDQMGHKDISMTVNRYGGLTDSARAALLAEHGDAYEGIVLPRAIEA